MLKIGKGANAPLASNAIRIEVTAPGADISAYMLNGNGRVRGDADFIFYNQAKSADDSIHYDGHSAFAVDLARVDPAIDRIALCATPESGTVGDMGRIGLRVVGEVEFDQSTTGMTEAAVIIGELYRRAGAWKMRAVAQGFNGGLAALSRHFGVDVAEDGPAPVPAAAPAPPPVPAPPPPVNLSKVDLRKHKVGVSLAKHGMVDEKADVLVVIDASGSMASLYADGTVQETVERIVPVAQRMDGDGKLDTWFYASRCRQVGALDEQSMIGFITREMPSPGHVPNGRTGLFGKRAESIGYGNNEPVVMNAILANEPATRTRPLFVIFLTDGGIDEHTSNVIKDVLRACSNRAVFWQFVGVGRANYGVLRDLDTIGGRVVDNAGFFAVDDLATISDDELYDRLLSEFPLWLKEARTKRILA